MIVDLADDGSEQIAIARFITGGIVGIQGVVGDWYTNRLELFFEASTIGNLTIEPYEDPTATAATTSSCRSSARARRSSGTTAAKLSQLAWIDY
jgi:hypothetical protein